MSVIYDTKAAALRRQAERARMDTIVADAMPPVGAAPVAPARGPMAAVDLYELRAGGTRHRSGCHMRDMCQLEIMVAQARLRHQARGGNAPFEAPFSPSQIAVGRAYRDLVEWREGSAMRCASVEALPGGGGGGSGLFIDAFIAQGEWLTVLRDRIGGGTILDVRRHMDRGNTRRPITARAAIDGLLVSGLDLSAILANHRWQVDGKNRKALRLGVAEALDRMLGDGAGPGHVLASHADGWRDDMRDALRDTADQARAGVGANNRAS